VNELTDRNSTGGDFYERHRAFDPHLPEHHRWSPDNQIFGYKIHDLWQQE